MTNTMIRTINLRRDFGKVRALDGLNLAVAKGTILALLGPNGAGKTTFLRIAMGMIEPSGGEVIVSGLQGRVAYVGDRCESPSWATPKLLEDLQAGAAERFDRKLFRDLCRRRELDLRRPYGSLSKGQRRWILSSLALASQAELILLDEPADGLDPAARRTLYECLRGYITVSDATAVVATHVVADVERIADEVAIIDAGRLEFHAPLEDLREQVRQVEIYGGRSIPDLGEEISLLGSSKQNDVQILWIRHDGASDDALRQKIGADIVIRRIALEELYLAIAEHRSEKIQKLKREQSNDS
jgi:ABC-2 type transport system ATP-binding protein